MIRRQHLDVLAAVVRYGSITRAAEALNLSQPSVSKIIKRLEDITNVPLFRRVQGRAQPTPEAELLSREAERLSEEMAAFQKLAADVGSWRMGTLRVSAVPAFGATILPRTVAAFATRWPDVRLHVEVAHPRQVLTEASRGRIDIGIVHYPSDDPIAGAETLCTGGMVCLLPADHPLAAEEVIGPGQLRGERLIGYRRSLAFADKVRKWLEADDAVTLNQVEGNYTTLVRDLVRHGTGIALVDEFTLWHDELPDLAVRPLVPAIPVSIGASYTLGRPLSGPAEGFLKLLRDHLSRPMLAETGRD